jgi:hypothetical protein
MFNLGRLVRTTDETCSECGRGKLQVRALSETFMVEGVEMQEDKKYLVCNKCDHEESFIDKKHDKKNKHREIKEIIEPKEVKNYGRHKERPNFKTGNDRSSSRGNK